MDSEFAFLSGRSHALKNEIERLVNDFKRSAQNKEKLDILESKSDDILQSTSNSLSSSKKKRKKGLAIFSLSFNMGY